MGRGVKLHLIWDIHKNTGNNIKPLKKGENARKPRDEIPPG